jgi:hypothetical protein
MDGYASGSLPAPPGLPEHAPRSSFLLCENFLALMNRQALRAYSGQWYGLGNRPTFARLCLGVRGNFRGYL